MSDDDRIDRERVERLRGQTQTFRREIAYINGVVDCFEVLLLAMVDRGIVPTDFPKSLIPELAERVRVWNATMPDRPDKAVNDERAMPLDFLLSKVQAGLGRAVSRPAERDKPN